MSGLSGASVQSRRPSAARNQPDDADRRERPTQVEHVTLHKRARSIGRALSQTASMILLTVDDGANGWTSRRMARMVFGLLPPSGTARPSTSTSIGPNSMACLYVPRSSMARRYSRRLADVNGSAGDVICEDLPSRGHGRHLNCPHWTDRSTDGSKATRGVAPIVPLSSGHDDSAHSTSPSSSTTSTPPSPSSPTSAWSWRAGCRSRKLGRKCRRARRPAKRDRDDADPGCPGPARTDEVPHPDGDHPPAAMTPSNTLGLHRVMFAVDDLEDTLARLRPHGA